MEPIQHNLGHWVQTNPLSPTPPLLILALQLVIMEGTAEEGEEEVTAAPQEGSRRKGQEERDERVALDEDDDEVGWQAHAFSSQDTAT